MAKKLILVIAALFGAGLLGLIFIYMNKDLSGTGDLYNPSAPNADILSGDDSDLSPISAGGVSVRASKDVKFIIPGKREGGYEKRVSNPDGMLQVLNPWVKLYSNNSIIRITAQNGLLPLDRDGDAFSASGPDHGILEGDVSIEVFRKPEDVSISNFGYEPEYKELAVKLGTTKFEREFSRIVGEGQIKVISQQFLASGQDLVMQYDQINQKLQLLEISQMQKLVVTVPRKKSENNSEDDVNSSQSVPEGEIVPTDFMTYYLNLSDNITVETEDETFTANNLTIMADIASGSKIIEENEKSDKTGNNQLVANNSINRENFNIVTMTCSGPLLITSPQEKYHSADGLPRLEIVANGNPVEIYRNGLLALKAEKVIYSQNTNNKNHEIRMVNKDRFNDLYLAQGLQQTITASNEICYDFNTNIATLAGPGFIHSAINADDESRIEFKDTIKIKFASQEQATGKISVPLNSSSQVEWIDCLGTVNASLKEGSFSADQTRINFNQSGEIADKGSELLIDNMIMTGNVKMSDSQSVFSCGKLILRFRSNNGISEPASLWAGSNVKAENPTYLIQASDHILINFGMARSGIKQAEEVVDQSLQTQTAFSDMSGLFDNLNPIYVIAEGQNDNVLFLNKEQNYSVRGWSIEGKLPDITGETVTEPLLAIAATSNNLSEDGIWLIKGNPAFIQLSQERTVSGPEILLDQNTGFCSIPGSGGLNLTTSGQIGGSGSVPVNIKWQDGVVYNIANNILALKDAYFEIDTLSKDNILQNSKLYAANVDIEIPPVADTTTGKIRYDLRTFRAYGPGLRLVSNEIDLLSNDLLSQSQLHAGQLTFENLPRPKLTASGGGWMEHVIICQRPAVKTDDDLIAELLGSENVGKAEKDQTGYYFLQFTTNMLYNIKDNDILFDNPVALHYLPIDPATQKPMELSSEHTLPAGGLRMFCDRLQIANSMTDKSRVVDRFQSASGNTSISNSIGDGRLGYIAASGNIFVQQTDNNDLEHIFTASEMLFDTQQQKFSIAGDEDNPARYDQLQFSYLNYDLATGNYNGKAWGQSAINTGR